MNGFDWGALAVTSALCLAAALAVLLVTFAVAVAKGLHRIVDVAWGLGFTAVAATAYGLSSGSGDPVRRALALALTAAWGIRLAVHIARRGRGHGEDPRYARMLERAPGNRNLYALRKVYLLQGALVWLVSLPVQAACFVPAAAGPVTWVGAALWLAGLLFEGVGDHQLARFKADPANHGRIMDRGLWSWTRHPNYFGDFLVWWGLYVMVCDDWRAAALAIVSPVVMSLLLTKGSGAALLERHMAGRPGWDAYAARTAAFFPRPPRARRP
ncbi:DUF1295 domain-containing protein [Streptomyces avicenniae]|uniref:DUF1295 domain-containing protein n=1 Tax=Streptomyces avicenniae TaxID=500153 RepID=UPI00069A1521|nr:DUF1295 domain-containing protein [Streptomyces avicenniae]